MEVKVEKLNYTYKGKKLLRDLSFSISSKHIVGLTGKYKSLVCEILDLMKPYQGEIFFDGEKIEKDNIRKFQQMVALISQEDLFFMDTVEEEMNFIVENYQYTSRDLKKRMLDALKLVGLADSFLHRKLETLSKSERMLIKVACAFLVNPKVILFDESFCYLSHNHKRVVLSLIQKMKERKDKLIVIASNDVNLLYAFTDLLVVLENGECIREDKTSVVFRDFSFLEHHQIELPDLIAFTRLAKEKGVRLSYHKDILDLIKDVYKHV